MRKIFIVIVIFLPNLIHAQTIVSSVVDSDLWIKQNSPYIIESDVVVRGSLVIEPGVVVQIGDAYIDSFKITGKIDVKGTKEDPVIFESYGQDTKNWSLVFDSPQYSSVEHAVFRNSLNGLLVRQGEISIKNSTFSNLYGCITIDHARTTLEHNLFTGCVNGGVYVLQGELEMISSSILGDGESQGISLREYSLLKIASSTLENLTNAIGVDNSTLEVLQSDFIANGVALTSMLSNIFIDQSTFQKNEIAITSIKPEFESVGGIGNLMSPEDKIVVRNSKFIDSSEYDISNLSDITIDAIQNWWGGNEGPKKNQGNILISPWLTKNAECCSNVLFIPGFQASRLHMGDNQLWEPNRNADVEKLFLNEKGVSNAGISVGEVVDKGFGYTIYDSLVKELNSLSISWKAFSYDWRRPQSDIAKDIIPTLEGLATSSVTYKVHIVSHSNGGLVAKAVLKQLKEMGKEYLVDSVVFIAVPHLGTPKTIASMLYGYDQQIAKGLILNKKTARQFGYNTPGAYALLPNTYTFPRGGVASSSKDIEKPIALNKSLFDKARQLHREIDSITFPKMYSITGWNLWTLDSLTTASKRGDGTVIASSSDIFKDAYYFDLQKFNTDKKKNIAHANITEAAPVLTLLKNILAGTITQDPYISRDYPIVNKGEVLEIKMFSPVDIHIYDTEGRHTGPSLSQKEKEEEFDIESDLFTFIDEEIPNSSYSELMDVKTITVPRQGIYTVKGIGTDAGVFTLQTSIDNKVISRYEDLPVLKESNLELKIDPQKTYDLKIDIDNDAIFESSIKPNRKRFINKKSFLDFCKKILPYIKRHEYRKYMRSFLED